MIHGAFHRMMKVEFRQSNYNYIIEPFLNQPTYIQPIQAAKCRDLHRILASDPFSHDNFDFRYKKNPRHLVETHHI